MFQKTRQAGGDVAVRKGAAENQTENRCEQQVRHMVRLRASESKVHRRWNQAVHRTHLNLPGAAAIH